MDALDIAFGALCAWREDRGGGAMGMTGVINVLQNRSRIRGTDIYTEATRHLQFSALTATGDPELTLFPIRADVAFEQALALMNSAQNGSLQDVTNGATQYYAKSMTTPPYWAARMIRCADIGGQIYFK